MKKEKNIIINNENFTIKNTLDDSMYWGVCSLYDCYDKPSCYKVNAWEYWKRFFYNIDINAVVTISGYNSCTFSIKSIFNYNNKKYVAFITRYNNYIKEI